MARKPKGRRRRNDDAGEHTLLHLNFSNKDLTDSSRYPKKVCDSKSIGPIAKSYKVTDAGSYYNIAEPNGGVPFFPILSISTLYKGLTYEFDFSDSSMVGNVFRLSREVDGVHEGGDQYTAGWTEFGTPGNADARAFFTVPSNVPSRLYYYDDNFDGYGISAYGEGSFFFTSLGQVGYSTGVYKSKSASANFSGDGFVFVSGYGYDHAADLNLKDDFSISFWMKASQTGGGGNTTNQCLFDLGGLTGYIKGEREAGYGNGDRVTVSMPTRYGERGQATEVDKVVDLENTVDINVSEWNHICLARESGFLSYYINGTGQGAPIPFTGKVFPTGNSSSGEYFSIGATRNYKDFYTGYIDDFFIHDINIYGRDGFMPLSEDASGKFPSPAKDGLTAKFNTHRVYLISDGGYRTFEMYNTDSVNTKLPVTGNIIQKDNTDYSDQYIYPFSGQDVILSFFKTPDILNPKDSTVKFYCDFGAGRKLVADDKGITSNLNIDTDSNFNDVKLLLRSQANTGSDPHYDNVSLLIQSETTDGSTVFLDSSENSQITGVGNIHHETDEAKWGSSSIYFDGNHDRLDISDHASLRLGTSDFTIETWFKPTNWFPTGQGILDYGTSGDAVWSHGLISNMRSLGGSPTNYDGWSLYYTYYANSGAPAMTNEQILAGSGICDYCGANVGGSMLQFFKSNNSPGTGAGGLAIRCDWNDIKLNQWHHAAVVRKNGVTRMYLDGNLCSGASGNYTGTARVDTEDYDSTFGLRIGEVHTNYPPSPSSNNGFPHQGYMEDVRITKGVARYDVGDCFSVPTQAFISGSVGGANFEDFSPSKRTITAYGDTDSASHGKFCKDSTLFDGVGDYIAVGGNNSDFEFKGVDFTMEAWIKTSGREATTGMGGMSLISKSNDGNFYNGWHFTAFKATSSTGLVFSVGADQADDPNSFCGGGNGITGGCPEGAVFNVTGIDTGLLDNHWHHVAASKKDKIVRLFVDGVEVGEEHFSGQSLEVFAPSSNTTIQIGRRYGPVYEATDGDYYKGDMSEFRVTVGKARYTDNFTLSTSEFPLSASSLGGRSLGSIHDYPRKSYFGSKEKNSIEVITDLRPQWRYNTTGNIDVNGVHLLINNIQDGFTGTWTAEHWAEGNVFSSPRKVIIKDVIGGTGCVRPEITGFNAMGQIMALANPLLSNVSRMKPTWTGVCGGFDKTLGNLDTDYKSSTYKFPSSAATGLATHYRIFSGWLDGNSLPSFEEVAGARYDGSTDNSNIKFIIREEPLGGFATMAAGNSATQGTKNHVGSEFYKEMTYAEVSGTPVTTFKYYDELTRNLVTTSGRLLISGDGNSTDDNGVNGQTCMYITAVDTVASDSCYISNSKETSTCFENCPDAHGSLTEIPSVSVRCAAVCAGAGYIAAGYTSTSKCEAACVACGGMWPWKGIQSPLGDVKVKIGESLKFNAATKRGNVSWCAFMKSEWTGAYPSKVDEAIECQDSCLEATGHASAFDFNFNFDPGTEMTFIPIYSYRDPAGTCSGLKMFGSEVNVTVEGKGDVSFSHPSTPINIQMKAGEVGRLTTNANGAKPISYKWYRGLESSPLSTLTEGQNNLNIGIISGSDCYHVKAWNGGFGDYVNNYRNMDVSEPICIECVEEKSQSQCCLTSTTRTFTITGSSPCKIASIKAYELWTSMMDNLTIDDYTNGRVIVPEVTSTSDKSWTTKWHYGNGGIVDGVCYNSGASASESQNNKWCVNNISGVDNCFTVSGCPDKIVYEVTTHEPLVDKAYSDYYNNSHRNKRLERQVFFAESPLGQTGNLQVEYASSASFTGDCPCAAPRKLNLNFPSYITGVSGVSTPEFTGSMGGAGRFIPTGSREDGVIRMRVAGFDAVSTRGEVCWNSNLTGEFGYSGLFNWYTGATESVRGSGFLFGYNTSNMQNPHGAPDKGNYKINFTGNLNEWDITVMANRQGIEGTGKHNYVTYYAHPSGTTTGSFVRTLKDNYMNIRSGLNHEILDLGTLVPATAAATSSGNREVDIYTNTGTQKLVFFVNQVDYVDSNPLLSGGAGFDLPAHSGYNQYQSTSAVASWAHQTVNTTPFLIRSGYINAFDYTTYSTFSGCSGSIMGGYDANLVCVLNNVLPQRNSAANALSDAEWNRAADKNLDLWAVLETGDVLSVKIAEPSGWNSYMHGKMLILNQPTGSWKNWTGAAQNPFFRTFVNGQEV